MAQKIVCIGDVVLDILPSIFPIAKEKILSDGETFIDSVTFQKGGCAANFSCIFKAIVPEADVQLVSRVGKLPYGDFLTAEIAKHGVVPVFTVDESVNTQVTIAPSYRDGQRHFMTYLGGLNNFSLHDIPENIFMGASHLAFRGIWFAERLLLEAEAFLRRAVDSGIDVSMDLGFDPYWNLTEKDQSLSHILETRRSAAFKILKYIKFLFGNEEEFLRLTDRTTLDDAIYELVNKGIKNIVVHRGKNGCRIIKPFSADPTQAVKSVDIPALNVEVKNPVGSGDTFDSILLAQVMAGKSLIQAAALATAGAAYSLMHPAGTAIDLVTVERFAQQFPELQRYLE